MNRFIAVLISAILLLSLNSPAQTTLSPINLQSTSATNATGEKPQSKTWQYDGNWYAVFPSDGNTILWKLNNGSWVNMLTLSNGNAYADCKSTDDKAYILLYKGVNSELVTLEYNLLTGNYEFSAEGISTVTLDASVETATMDIDSNGRMWIASDGSNTVNVRWSDHPYTNWSNKITIANNITNDDICAIIFLGDKMGVMWSDQNAQRYGFRTIGIHSDPSVISNWGDNEVPASQSAINAGNGMSDDHINMKMGPDGKLYAAIKTSYDASDLPRIALLVRNPSGVWENIHDVGSAAGTRPIVIINEATEKLKVLYSSSDGGGNIVYKESPLSTIQFSTQQTLIAGNYNNITAAKANYEDEMVLLASNASSVTGVKLSEIIQQPGESLVLHLDMEEEGGNTLTDLSEYQNNATITGVSVREPGIFGNGLNINNATGYALVNDAASLNITNEITIAAWIKPQIQGTQRIVYKLSGSAGYELFLANPSPQQFSVRFNNNASLRVNSTSSYMNYINEWVHVAATYDGNTIKLYVNGILENSLNASFLILPNNSPLAIGATHSGGDKFRGSVDEVIIHNKALTQQEITELVAIPLQAPTLLLPENNSMNVSTSPNLYWNEVEGADSYHLQVSINPAFSSLEVDNENITETNIQLTELAPSTQYYWRVKTITAGNESNWSESRTFTTTSGVPPSGPLVGFWAFEEAGSISIDSSSYMNNGNIVGTPSLVQGKKGAAFRFNGTGDYISVPDAASLAITEQITLAAWIKPENQATQYIIRKGIQGSVDGYEISLGNGGEVFFRINQASKGNNYRVNSTTPYPVNGNTWMHVAGTYDGSQLKIYINGVLESTVTISPVLIATNNLPLTIGAQSNGSSLFRGTIDEAKVFNIALEAAEISNLYHIPPIAPELISPANNLINVNTSKEFSWTSLQDVLNYHYQLATTEDFSALIIDTDTITQPSVYIEELQLNTTYFWRVKAISASGSGDWSTVWTFSTSPVPVPSNMVLHLRFEEADYNILSDASSFNNNGTTEGNPGRAKGITGNALNLNGSGQYGLIPSHPSLDITSQITLAAWIQPQKRSTQYIIRKGIQSSGGGGVNGYELSLSNPGNVFFRFNQAESGDTYRVNSISYYPTDGETWMHVAGTYDGEHLKIYINGVLERTVTVTGAPLIITNDRPLAIGAQSSGSVSLEGSIDDVRIFNTALSEIEIQDLITAALPVKMGAFTARMLDNSILLNWNTFTEENNSGFFIERSTDGLSFENIGFVPSKSVDGNSTVNLNYTYTDPQPVKGNVYYRLKQVDRDGKKSYSKIVGVGYNMPFVMVTGLFPNPTSGKLMLAVVSEKAASYTISIKDVSGRNVLSNSGTLLSGKNHLSLDVTAIPAGTYFMIVAINGPENDEVIQFIKK